MPKVVIIGAGPAGLTAGYELLKKSEKYDITIIEESANIGGISRTVNYKNNRMDIGGHRFFSKSQRVNDWWNEILPMPSRKRISRIYFSNTFFDYPISLKSKTLKNLGFINTIKVLSSYIFSIFHKLPETNLENFYINRFGKKLYKMFFEKYTENLWGRHPREIDASWGAQRVKGVSITAVIKNIFCKKHNKETSLIDKFLYPDLGPGELWETVADKIVSRGGKILTNSKVVKIYQNNNKIEKITYLNNGENIDISADIVISSMPIKDLCESLNDIPERELEIAKGLPYRDFMTIGILVDKKKFNKGKELPDCWMYIHDQNVKIGRIQIFNNWSSKLVDDYYNKIWLGLEYFVKENDELWNMQDKDFSKKAISELIKLSFIESENDVLDYHIERVKKAYPAYFDTYKDIDIVRKYLDNIENLYCIGRNGQHRYNNMDHSMITAFEAVYNIENDIQDRSNIWNVNTEQKYHEK